MTNLFEKDGKIVNASKGITIGNQHIINPKPSKLAELGYIEHIPPVVEPTPITNEAINQLREMAYVERSDKYFNQEAKTAEL